MRRVSALLKDKAIASIRRMVTAFNGLDDEGRQTAVLIALQHAFEMLLKAALRERRVVVFDKRTGRSIGLEKCLRLSQEHLKLSDDQLGVLRTIDNLRDEEQHWLAQVNEGLLYVHARAAITLFDEILNDVFHERLAEHLPERVLPVSTRPMTDVDVLFDEQYRQVRDLLQPGRRRRVEARSLLRGLLAMEGHVSDEAQVSEKDVNRVERGVRDGKPLEQVFPRLTAVAAKFTGDGPTVKVHFTKRQGAPVHFVPADDPRESAAVREVDLQRKYHLSARDLAERLELTQPRATALRRHLGIDEDPDCRHDFTFGKLQVTQYSDNALTRMRDALNTVDMDEVWVNHRPRRRRTPSA
jgi:hypothetical protein